MAAKRSGWVYAFAHFATEVTCFFWMYRYVTADALWALAYDVLAFVPQLFLGMAFDRRPERNPAPTGMVLMGAALAGAPVLFRAFGAGLWRIPLFLCLTLGNCLVHVAGAEATARGAEGKMGPAGIFVGGGSFGLIVGRLLGAADREVLLAVPALLLAAAFALTLRSWEPRRMRQAASGFRAAADRPLWLVTVLVFLTVAVRAYIGYAIPTGWVRTTGQLVTLYVFMGVGKMLGGVLADRFGARRTAVISLVLALPLLIAGSSHMAVSLLGVLLFSMTMAISFGILLSEYPDLPGFAFGITTLALCMGTVPAFFVPPGDGIRNTIVICVLSAVAIVCFALSASDRMRKES